MKNISSSQNNNNNNLEISWKLRKNRILFCFNSNYGRIKYLLWALQNCTICDICLDHTKFNLSNHNMTILHSKTISKNHTIIHMSSMLQNNHNNHNKTVKDIISLSNEVRLSHRDLWNTYSEYKFVFSPHGNGFDCGRTWEIMLLGSIPIIPYFPGVRGYIRGNLTVIVVNKPEDVNESNLMTWVKKYSYQNNNNMNNPHYLSREYWMYKTIYESI